MPVTDLPIIGYFDRQRFRQFNPSDCANWFLVKSEIGKKKVAMYPTLGRRHVRFTGLNRLIFESEPRVIYKSLNYWYAVVNDKIFRVDLNFNQVEITASVKLATLTGNVFFDYIVVGDPALAGNTTYSVFTDGQFVYVYNEVTNVFVKSTDTNTPKFPIFIATFGNRIAVSGVGSSTFVLSAINLLGGVGGTFDPAKIFTVSNAQVFAQESGIIRQMAVLQNTLYIFTDFTAGIWSNIPSPFTTNAGTTTTFPWKKNTTYEFDYGMADPNTLSVDYGLMVWVGKNRDGLLQMLASSGGKPKPFSSKAIDVLLQRISNAQEINPFLQFMADGFLYDYENTIFYRVSAGKYQDFGVLDQVNTTNSIEYNFETDTWHRVIEANGERNRIQDHVFFGNRHLVTLEGDSTVYEMSGEFYNNEIRNPDQPDAQASDAYLQLPFRYERVTPIICSGVVDVLTKLGAAYYDEFITDWVEIDFVWGIEDFINSTAPFENAVYIIAEEPDSDGNPVYVVSEEDTETFLVSEQGNFPVLNSPTYHAWFKPHVELQFSDDGGISFLSADNLEFSQLGVYQWRMRWNQLGTSRNRVYKLICVSPAPIVVLGAQMSVRRASGGAS